MKVIIVSIDKTFLKWRTLDAKLEEIENTLNTMQNADFDSIVVSYQNLIPEVKNGRITHDWMDSLSNPYWREGYDFVVLHMSRAQRRELTIQSTLNGAYHVDYDPVSEMYVMADEMNRRGSFNHFVQTTLHELRHAITRATRVTDDTHTLHADNADIRPHFATIDMARYQPTWHNLKAQVNVLTQVVQLLQRIKLMKTPTLYEVALRVLGTDASPRDIAPDDLGCAESVSELIRTIIPTFPRYTGTASLREALDKHPRFRKVTVPMPGTIIVSPTDIHKPYPGHAGIFLAGNKIASSTSATGKFESNYTLATWQKRWGKFPTFYYSLIN